jgi:hypothetical protein
VVREFGGDDFFFYIRVYGTRGRRPTRIFSLAISAKDCLRDFSRIVRRDWTESLPVAGRFIVSIREWERTPISVNLLPDCAARVLRSPRVLTDCYFSFCNFSLTAGSGLAFALYSLLSVTLVHAILRYANFLPVHQFKEKQYARPEQHENR